MPQARGYICIVRRDGFGRCVFAFDLFRNVYGKLACYVTIRGKTYWIRHGW